MNCGLLTQREIILAWTGRNVMRCMACNKSPMGHNGQGRVGVSPLARPAKSSRFLTRCQVNMTKVLAFTATESGDSSQLDAVF